MEVTSRNFQEVLTELDDVLEKAAFLAIDGEFTGLNSGADAGVFDTPAEYYRKLQSGSMDFLLIQFGLSVFSFDKETNKYTQRSYNFYVFPTPLNRMTTDCRFMCQASCISFLACQGFDFNKLFNLGIPYLTPNEEETLLKRIEEKKNLRGGGHEVIPIPDDDKPEVEEICGRISDFIKSNEEELIIDRCNGFIRRVVHQEARMRWPNKVRIENKSDTHQYLVVQKRGTKEEEEQKDIERIEKEILEVQEAVGLSTLLRKIADSEKLIVGHNMLLDLCHIIHQFFAPLPKSYREFKSLVHGLFPRILDTKVLCNSQHFKESLPFSNLVVMLDRIKKPPFSIPEVESVEGRSYSTTEEKTHEAGFDAYITGLCFIAMSNYLGSLQKPEISTVLGDSPLLEPYLNKLLIARLKDLPYINIVGEDPIPNRDYVFHVTFPKQWKNGDLSQLFSPFGAVFVSWLSDTSAYVGLYRRDQASAVIEALNKPSSVYEVQKYKDHRAALESNADDVQNERKRKLSSTEGPSAVKDEQKRLATNGVKSWQNEDGWMVATDNNPASASTAEANDSTEDCSRCLQSPDSVSAGNKTSEVPRKDCQAKAKVCVPCEKYVRTLPVVASRTKQTENSHKRSSSPKKVSRTPGISPSASPKLKRSPKKQARGKNEGQEVANEEATLRKRVSCVEDDYGSTKVELKKPTLKLLRSARKREGVFITAGLIVKLAKVAGVLLLIYVIVAF